MRCARHPEVETGLTCGKCGTPVCPRCLVQTPVGVRCRSCARLRRLPTFQVSYVHYAKAVGASLGLALLGGLGSPYLIRWLPFGFYAWVLIIIALGYVYGQAISLAVNRKRGTGLQVIAGGSLLLSYIISSAIAPWFGGLGLLSLLGLGLGVWVAISPFR